MRNKPTVGGRTLFFVGDLSEVPPERRSGQLHPPFDFSKLPTLISMSTTHESNRAPWIGDACETVARILGHCDSRRPDHILAPERDRAAVLLLAAGELARRAMIAMPATPRRERNRIQRIALNLRGEADKFAWQVAAEHGRQRASL